MAEGRVLIVEDDPTLLRAVGDNFRAEGYDVVTAADGLSGLRAALDESPELIVLDIMLPEINGFEVCRRIRAEGLDTPICMLTAKGQESDIVLGLNLGADDYVTKPFGVRELLARAAALLRRRRSGTEEVVRFGVCELDVASHRFRRDGREIELTPKEFDLMAYFASRPNRALTRDQILQHVWGFGVFVTRRSVDRCVNTLRGKVEDDVSRPRHIRTVREVGYRFEPD